MKYCHLISIVIRQEGGKSGRFNLLSKSLTNNKFAHKPDKSRKLNRPLSRQITFNNVVNGLWPGLVLKSKDVKLKVCKNKSVVGVPTIQSEFMSVHSDYQLLTTCVCQPFYSQPKQPQRCCSTEATFRIIFCNPISGLYTPRITFPNYKSNMVQNCKRQCYIEGNSGCG